MSIYTYTESTLAPETERVREFAFTRWMSRDLRQAAADFCKNIGLSPIYCQARKDGRFRYLFWHPPEGAKFQVKSGYTENNFNQMEQQCIELGWNLLTLHISSGKEDLYSSVWIAPEFFSPAVDTLRFYGISPAERISA